MDSSILLLGLPTDVDASLDATVSELGLRRATDATGRPAVAVISLDRDASGRIQTVQALASTGTRVAVAAHGKDADLILAAMRAGAREFVSSSDRSALDAVIRNLLRPSSAAPRGTVTAVFSAKGGMGATSIAANVAGFLAARQERVCLVDVDLELGDVPALLDLACTYSLADVVENMPRLERKLLAASIAHHRSGIAVLARGETLDDASRVGAESVSKLLGFLREHYAHVIVDGLHGFGDQALAALDGSDRIVLLVTQEVAAVRNAQRCLEIFHRIGYPDSKIELVVNRFHKGSRITREVVSETTGVPVAATIANDFALLSRAVNRGNLLPEEAPRSAIARDIETLAALIGGALEPAPRRSSFVESWKALRGALAHGAQ